MNFGNSQFDLAELRSEQEREQAIADASRALKAIGSIDCSDCPETISRERRIALPSATRCVACQQRHERADAWRRA